MLRLTAERPNPWTEGGARTGHPSTITEDIGVHDCTIKSPAPPAPASRTRAKAIRTTLIVALGLALVAAGILGAGWLADHLPNLILGLCVILLGVLVGAMLAARA